MKKSIFSATPLRPLRLCGSLFLVLAAIATAKPPTATRPQPTAVRQPPTIFHSSPYGNGTRTTDSQGRTYTTTPYGNGTRTTGPGGSSYQTSRYGNGTVTKGTGTPPPVVPVIPKK